MEAKVKRAFCKPRALCAFTGLAGMVLAFGGLQGLPAAGQLLVAAPPVEWHSDSLDLTFKYPGDLVRRDPAEAWQDGHLMVYGIPQMQAPGISTATKCLKPLLVLELPTSGGEANSRKTVNADGSTTITLTPPLLGTVMLAELDISCMTPEQQVKAQDLQLVLPELVAKVPGMHAMMQPAMYTVLNQRVHVAAGQGEPKVSEDATAAADPLLTYTMGFATSWNNHLLVWYFSSNNSGTLNRLTKSTVRFGRAKEAPLYPVQIGYRTR